MTKFLKISISIFLFFAILIYLIFGTVSGTRLLIKNSFRFVPGKLNVARIEGTLLSKLQLQNITYSNEKTNLNIQALTVQWRPSQLLHKRITLTEIKSNQIQLDIQQSTSSAKVQPIPFNQFKKYITIFKYVVIKHAQIQDFKLYQSHQLVYDLQLLMLNQQPSKSYNLNILSSRGNIAGDFKFHWRPTWAWQLNLDVSHLMPSLNMQKNHSEINFHVLSEGEWHHQQKRFDLKINNVNGQLQGYPVTGNVAVTYNKGQLKLSNTFIKAAHAQFNVEGSIDHQWHLTWGLTIPKLSELTSEGAGTIAVSGKFIDEDRPYLAADLKINNLKLGLLQVARIQGNVRTPISEAAVSKINLNFKSIIVNQYDIPQLTLFTNLQWLKTTLIAITKINFNAGNSISSSIRILNQPTYPIDGRIKIGFNRINNQMLHLPYLENLVGKINGDVQLAGTLFQPKINAALNGATSFDVPKLGLALELDELQAHYQTANPLTFSSILHTKTGEAKLNGQFDLQQKEIPLTLNLIGENLTVADLKSYRIRVSPNLQLLYQDHLVHLKGTIDIPYAKISPTDFSNVVTLPDEVEFVHQAKPTTNFPINLATDIAIHLGQAVHLTYANLNASLGGNLKIQQTPERLPIAQGELTIIKGQYRAYGHILKIKSGRLIYNGNALIDPGLDIQAYKKIQTIAHSGESQFTNSNQIGVAYEGSQKIEVGIWAKGTLKNPHVELYSDPAGINQADILSYLVFGYPQSQINAKSSLALLNSLASTLNTKSKGVGITDKLQNVLGLSDLSVGNVEYFDPTDMATGSTTSVSIAKKLGKKFSIRYTVGVFHPVQIINLKYLFSKHLALQSESSNLENGADLFYEFEVN